LSEAQSARSHYFSKKEEEVWGEKVWRNAREADKGKLKDD